MLVFTRKLGETIVIAGNIRITVLEFRGGKVRLGIAAPDSIRVDREEIHQSRVQWNANIRGGRKALLSASLER